MMSLHIQKDDRVSGRKDLRGRLWDSLQVNMGLEFCKILHDICLYSVRIELFTKRLASSFVL